METTTINLSKFGYRERKMAEELLRAWREQGLPEDFYDDEVSIMLNINSGYVFLTNADYQVAMLNGDKLESFYVSPYEGREGFCDELAYEYDSMHPEDKEWLNELRESIER